LSGLQKEIEEKCGAQLPIKKIQAGYYQLDGNIVNLKLDENQPRILSKSIQVNIFIVRIQQPGQSNLNQFADFIDYLVSQGHLQGLAE
jgi:hypothetical protein